MAGERDDARVQVLTSTRMPDPNDPNDVVHGKRFTNPRTGEPASIPDILVALGMLKPDPEDGGEPPVEPEAPLTSEGRP